MHRAFRRCRTKSSRLCEIPKFTGHGGCHTGTNGMGVNYVGIHTLLRPTEIKFVALTMSRLRGSTVGWGTALPAGRSRPRFPMGSLKLFIELIIPPHYDPGFDSACNRSEYHRSSLGGRGGRSIGLTTLPLSCKDWKSWNPRSRSKPA